MRDARANRETSIRVEKIVFDTRGEGPSVILLHGFPMNRKVWSRFADKLGRDFKLFTPDLPGLGDSPEIPGVMSLEAAASVMLRWMDRQAIEGSTVIGHSMGGYVALEMVRQAPHRFKGLCLFHSTALADSEEKKESRTKVLKFIDDNGVYAFTANFIHPLFAEQNHPAIASVKDITTEATSSGVKMYTSAMRDRRDNTNVLRDFAGDALLIGGDQDKGISVESLLEQGQLSPRVEARILTGTAHMGMFEKEEESLEIIRSFLGKIYYPGVGGLSR